MNDDDHDDDNDDSEVPNPGSLIHSAWVKGEFIKTLQKNHMGRCIVSAPLLNKNPVQTIATNVFRATLRYPLALLLGTLRRVLFSFPEVDIVSFQDTYVFFLGT